MVAGAALAGAASAAATFATVGAALPASGLVVAAPPAPLLLGAAGFPLRDAGAADTFESRAGLLGTSRFTISAIRTPRFHPPLVAVAVPASAPAGLLGLPPGKDGKLSAANSGAGGLTAAGSFFFLLLLAGAFCWAASAAGFVGFLFFGACAEFCCSCDLPFAPRLLLPAFELPFVLLDEWSASFPWLPVRRCCC